jgi:hypothetical protein
MKKTILPIVAIFALIGCAPKMTMETLPVKNSQTGGVIYILPNTSNGEIYQVKQNDIYIAPTGFGGKSLMKNKYLILKCESGKYMFKVDKKGDAVEVDVGVGDIIFMSQDRVWDAKSVLQTALIPLFAGANQKLTLKKMQVEDGLELLSKFRANRSTEMVVVEGITPQ